MIVIHYEHADRIALHRRIIKRFQININAISRARNCLDKIGPLTINGRIASDDSFSFTVSLRAVWKHELFNLLSRLCILTYIHKPLIFGRLTKRAVIWTLMCPKSIYRSVTLPFHIQPSGRIRADFHFLVWK